MEVLFFQMEILFFRRHYHKKLRDSKFDILTFDKSSDTISFGIEGVYNGISNDSFSYSANKLW